MLHVSNKHFNNLIKWFLSLFESRLALLRRTRFYLGVAQRKVDIKTEHDRHQAVGSMDHSFNAFTFPADIYTLKE